MGSVQRCRPIFCRYFGAVGAVSLYFAHILELSLLSGYFLPIFWCCQSIFWSCRPITKAVKAVQLVNTLLTVDLLARERSVILVIDQQSSHLS